LSFVPRSVRRHYEANEKLRVQAQKQRIDAIFSCQIMVPLLTPVGQVASNKESPACAEEKPIMNIALWIIQGLLAALFLFAGGMKLVLSLDQMAAMGSPNQIPLPGWFIRFTGVVEVLGALGLILPGLLRIRPELTALAAAGLVLVMIGAVAFTVASGDIGGAVIPLVVGVLAAFVAYGRWRLAPLRGSSSQAVPVRS
jgi:uncharacterized membrane protein YphA (DoxX/SURF4 family)